MQKGKLSCNPGWRANKAKRRGRRARRHFRAGHLSGNWPWSIGLRHNLKHSRTDRVSNYAPGRMDGGDETLQSIRRRDYNALDPHATLVIVDQAITYLRSRRETLEAEAARLEGLRPVLSTPHWRKDRDGQPRYLYLIHPHTNGSRRREYIGTDPDKQAEALTRVEAYEKLVQVRAEIREVDHRLAAITGHRSAERSRRSLARALLAAVNGLDSYW